MTTPSSLDLAIINSANGGTGNIPNISGGNTSAPVPQTGAAPSGGSPTTNAQNYFSTATGAFTTGISNLISSGTSGFGNALAGLTSSPGSAPQPSTFLGIPTVNIAMYTIGFLFLLFALISANSNFTFPQPKKTKGL
jgi:hypothetical protein